MSGTYVFRHYKGNPKNMVKPLNLHYNMKGVKGFLRPHQ